MGTADVTQAQLSRDMWARYQEKFLPMMTGLSKDLMSDARLKETLAEIPGATEQAFQSQADTLAAQRERMGIDSSLSQSAQTKTDIAKATSQAGAENLLRQGYRDLKQQAILGGTAAGGVYESD